MHGCLIQESIGLARLDVFTVTRLLLPKQDAGETWAGVDAPSTGHNLCHPSQAGSLHLLLAFAIIDDSV